ncbi:hypothetical protein ACHAQH_009641, partial [Verticillium albo-atrum]
MDIADQSMVLKLLGWNQSQVDAPRWALLSDSYAAVASSPSSVGTPGTNPDKGHHYGSDPFLLSPAISKADLRDQLVDAKESGCIGIIIEIVDNQYNGRVFDPVLLKRLRRVCAEVNLILAVDETLTAIRCGAPFSFQREEYAEIDPPDLVFFGRVMCAHGTAINFAAPFSWFDLSTYEDVDDLPGSGFNTTLWIPQTLHSEVVERYFRDALPQSLDEVAKYGEILEWEHFLRTEAGKERERWLELMAGPDSELFKDNPPPINISYFDFIIEAPSRRCREQVCELNFDDGRVGDVNGPGVFVFYIIQLVVGVVYSLITLVEATRWFQHRNKPIHTTPGHTACNLGFFHSTGKRPLMRLLYDSVKASYGGFSDSAAVFALVLPAAILTHNFASSTPTVWKKDLLLQYWVLLYSNV